MLPARTAAHPALGQALPRIAGALPRLDAIGPNIDLGDEPNAQSETSIAVSPANASDLAAGSNDIQPGATLMDAYLSSDGGQTWARTTLPLTDSLGETGGFASDPSLVATPDGAFHYGYILVSSDLQSASVVVATYRSGAWGTPVVVDDGLGRYFDDKPMLAAGPAGDLYMVWTKNVSSSQQEIEVSASTDGGATWTAPVSPETGTSDSPLVLFGQVAPMPSDSGVYVVWDDYGLQAYKSVLMGALCTWQGSSLSCGTPATVGQSNVNLDGPGPLSSTDTAACDGADLGNNPYACYAIPPQPDRGISAAPSIVADGSGDVFAVWDTAPAPAASSTSVVMAKLGAGQSRWSAPVTLSTNSGSSDYAFFPWIAYDAATGDLAVSFYSTAVDPTYHEAVDDYLTYSLNGGETWAPPVAVSTSPSDEGPRVTGSDVNDYGDYEGLAVAHGIAHPIWTDTRDLASLGEEVFTTAWSLVPMAPVVTIGGTDTKADLTWTAVPGATSYNVYGGTQTPPTQLLTSVSGSVTAATYSGLQAGQQYYFAVSAIGTAGEGALSPATPTVPTAAPVPSAPSVTTTTADLSWSTVAGAVYYSVYQAGSVIGQPATTTYDASGLSPGTAYTFTVAAVGLDGAGPASSPLAVSTTAAASSGGGGSAGGGGGGGGGGGASGGGGGSTGGTTTQPGTTALTSQNIGAAVGQAGSAPTITVPLAPNGSGVATLTLSPGALTALTAAGKGVTATVGGDRITLPAGDLSAAGGGLTLQVASVPQAQLTLGAGERAAGDGVTLGLSLTGPLPRPVRLTLPFSGSGPVAIYWVNAPGGPQPVPGVAGSGTVTADLHHFSTYAPVAATSAFTDTAGSWAASDIAAAAAQGLVQGVGGGLFQPDGAVTRAQLAQLLTRALAVPPAPGSGTPFGDVAPDAWYAAAVAAAQNAGLMDGMGNGDFAPNRPVTREQLAAALARALGYLGGSYVLPAFRAAGPSFADAGSIDPWASQAATYVAEVGLMQGLPGGIFDPLAPVTRAQAAAVLVRLVGLIEGSPIR